MPGSHHIFALILLTVQRFEIAKLFVLGFESYLGQNPEH